MQLRDVMWEIAVFKKERRCDDDNGVFIIIIFVPFHGWNVVLG